MADQAFIPKPHELAGILAGRQSQFRRVLKPQPEPSSIPYTVGHMGGRRFRIGHLGEMGVGDDWLPPYAVGDRLVVKETFAYAPRTAYRASVGTGTIEQREHPTDGYTAAVFREGFDRSGRLAWRSPATMPRWASRITLTVTEVRCQRVQEISEADAIAEGIELLRPGTMVNPQGLIGGSLVLDRYARLWDSLHGPDAWQRNDWVFAYTFATTRANVDALGTAA